MPVFVVCLLIVVLAVLGGVGHVISKYIPTKDRMDLNEYYGQVAEGEAALDPGNREAGTERDYRGRGIPSS